MKDFNLHAKLNKYNVTVLSITNVLHNHGRPWVKAPIK